MEIILELYQDFIPESPTIKAFETSSDPDLIAVSLLSVSTQYIVPCPVIGDGNCLFRAVSKAIYWASRRTFRHQEHFDYFQP